MSSPLPHGTPVGLEIPVKDTARGKLISCLCPVSAFRSNFTDLPLSSLYSCCLLHRGLWVAIRSFALGDTRRKDLDFYCSWRRNAHWGSLSPSRRG